MNVKSIRLSNRADSKLAERKKNNKRNKEKATKKGMWNDLEECVMT